MVGVTEQSLPRALRWANMAREAGADMILATPPYSYPIPQEWVFHYFKELTRLSRMPLVVYQNDEVAVRVEDDTIGRFSEVPGIIGVKAYMPYLRLQKTFYQYNRPGRFLIMGADEYLYGVGLFLGIRHFTMGGPGNLNMRWCREIFIDALANDWDTVKRKQKRLIEFCDAVYSVAESPYPVVKYVLHRLGVCRDFMASPLQLLGPAQKKKIDLAMKKFSDVLDWPV
jgi:dihydrodipicolinate synthase/N-acetylneuraminate lyase